MQHVTRSTRILFSVILAISLPVAVALSQSGRGRPRIPPPNTTTNQPRVPISIPAATAAVKQEQAGTASRFLLRNGITVVINEQHANPIVAAVACFKASTSEGGGDAAATIIERLILNGTTQQGGSSVDRLRALGAQAEVGLSRGCATYSIFVSPSKLKDALTIQADALENPQLDEDSIRAEATRVAEEARLGILRDLAAGSYSFPPRTLTMEIGDRASAGLQRVDDPASYSRARLVDTAFGDASANPFSVEALRSISRDQLLESYRNRYRPENLIVSVAGDVTTFDTLVMIQQLYGGFGEPKQAATSSQINTVTKNTTGSAQKPRKEVSPPENSGTLKVNQSPESKPATSVPQERLRYAADRGDITQPIISVGLPVPGAESKDRWAIEVLAALLGQGRGSRLSRSLIDQQMSASRVEAYYLTRQESGFLAIQIWPSADAREGSTIDKAEAGLFKTLDAVRRELPTDGELARAKSILEKRHLDETATYLGRATDLAFAEADGSGWNSVLDYRARIRAVSAADVQRVAAAHVAVSKTSIHEYQPLSAGPRTFDSDTFSKTVVLWAPGLAQPVDSASVRAADAAVSLAPVPQGSERSPEQRALMESVQPLPIKDFSTLNGPRAYVREDHSQPNVTIAILFQGGRAIEDSSTSGTTELMLRSILYGTSRLTSSRITDELEQLGADVRIVAEPDFFGFSLSVLSRNAERALKLVRDEIEEPAFRDEDIARAQVGQIAAIREARDSSIERAHQLLLQSLFPGHPYSLPPHGREEVVAALNSDKVREWHSRIIKRQLPIAIIVGDTDGSALVSSVIAEGFRRRDTDNAIQAKAPDFAKPSEKTEQRLSQHSTLAVGVGGPKGDGVDRAASQLIEAAINVEGGRSQEQQNLVSAASLGDNEFLAARVIWIGAMTSPENEQRARAALLAKLEGLTRAALTTNELAAARALAATAQLAMLQSQTQHALQYAREIFYRRQAADLDTIDAQTARLTAEDIKRVASNYFKAGPASSVIVRGAPTQAAPSPPKQN